MGWIWILTSFFLYGVVIALVDFGLPRNRKFTSREFPLSWEEFKKSWREEREIKRVERMPLGVVFFCVAFFGQFF